MQCSRPTTSVRSSCTAATTFPPAAHLSGMKRDEWVAPIPGLPARMTTEISPLGSDIRQQCQRPGRLLCSWHQRAAQGSMRDALLEGFIHSQIQLDNALRQQSYVNYTLFRLGGTPAPELPQACTLNVMPL